MGTILALLDWSRSNLQVARTPRFTVVRGTRWGCWGRGWGVIESRREETQSQLIITEVNQRGNEEGGRGEGSSFLKAECDYVIRANDGWQVVHLAGMDKGVRWDLALTGNAGGGLTTKEEERKIPVGCSLILRLRQSSRCDPHAILRRKGQTDLELDWISLSCCKKQKTKNPVDSEEETW